MGFSKGNVEKCRICTFLEFIFDFGLTLSLEGLENLGRILFEKVREKRDDEKEKKEKEGQEHGKGYLVFV